MSERQSIGSVVGERNLGVDKASIPKIQRLNFDDLLALDADTGTWCIACIR